MYDVLPTESWMWQKIENTCQQVFDTYYFQEIRFPILEKTQLFHSAIGEATDVVEKEMFSFASRSGNSISLRPEGTAGCVRAVIQNDLCNRGMTQKLWYKGPMFRYERPQKGRNRQFTQIGAEIFNIDNAQADAELILMSARLWQQLKLPNIRLEINSLGTTQARLNYRTVLIEYFKSHIELLDEDALRRLESNPLRILDSKNPNMRAIIAKAPVLSDYLDEESKQHFQQLTDILDACGIKYTINPKLVRGLDYYSKTVFEWITDDLGAQGTICAGGRYDALVEMQGGKPTPAVGFAMGVDRIVELVKDLNLWQVDAAIDAYLVADKTVEVKYIQQIAEKIRTNLPKLRLLVNQTPASFKSQFKKCDKLAAQFAIIIGENEQKSGKITLKAMQDAEFGQKELSFEEFLASMNQFS
ncbi:MAG TPA: histidine--tRNA ligase [Oceanospirillales bacterium]|nr:histidine--tRNA ligase [Oceanospirillales bacterium]